jgi:hypothetical protein
MKNISFVKDLLQFIIVLLVVSCVGPEGKVGPTGKNSLILITEEITGSNCSNGGQKIQTGIDLDGNGQLSPDEVSTTKYVCNGKNGLINVVSEKSGINCSMGGLKIETGIDNNGNGFLELSEITQTKYVCNGQNGLNSLTMYTEEPEGKNCKYGGFKVQIGLDINGDLTLSSNEVQNTRFICLPSGMQVGDKQIRIEIGESNVGTYATDWFIIEFQTFHLIKFNKHNYANVDSITFVPSMYTSSSSNKVYVELFNLTDNVPIGNTLLTSNTNEWIFKESGNIYDLLPDKEITLAIRLKSENPDYYVYTGIRSYLFIYKH